MFESFQKFYIIKEFNDFITKLVLKKVKIICINSIGFDKRGMKSLEILNQFSDRLDIEFLVIYIKENAYLHDNNIVTYLNENTIAADKLLISKKVLKFDLNPLDYLSFKNHVEINLINEINAFKPAWVLIDISALPRDYFFVLVRYFLESKMPNV